MSKVFAILALAMAAAGVPAQAPALRSDLGFTFNLPSGWQKQNAPQPEQPKPAIPAPAANAEVSRSAACAHVTLFTADNEPGSAVAVTELAFDCLGQASTDLAGFGQGAAEGLKQSFAVNKPLFGSYTLGGHSMWIERVTGTTKEGPDTPYTIEVACSLLKKGAVCWMTIAASADALKTFETGEVALEGEPPTALVPASAFNEKPAS